jgi:hypothetical protein
MDGPEWRRSYMLEQPSHPVSKTVIPKGKKIKIKINITKITDPLFRSLGRFLGRVSGDLIAQEARCGMEPWSGRPSKGSKCGDDGV